MWKRVLACMAFRWVCFAVMTVLAVWNEGRPGRAIGDPFLALFAYVPWVERWNYMLWLAAWLPGVFALLALSPPRFCRLMIAGGILSLLRGICIVATGLAPVRGGDPNAALAWDWDLRWQVVGQILNPFAVFFADSAQIWLTKDLFYSGHVASTFVLLLYAWPFPRLRAFVAAMHVLVVASLFFGWIHFTIDVLGAWLAAALVFAAVERVSAAARRPVPAAAL